VTTLERDPPRCGSPVRRLPRTALHCTALQYGLQQAADRRWSSGYEAGPL